MGDREPLPEEHVDIYCPSCDGMWCTEFSGIYELGGPQVVYKNYIGTEHSHLCEDTFREYHTCPNGCKNHWGDPILLERFDSYNRNTPWQNWKRRQLESQLEDAERLVDELEEELKNYEEG